MECLVLRMRQAKLLAFRRQMRAREYFVRQLRAFEVGYAVANNNALVLLCGKFPHNCRFAHAAIIGAIPVAWMRPQNFDSLAAKVTPVTVNMTLWNIESGQNRVNKKIDAAARYVKLNLLLFAECEKVREAVTDAGIANAEVDDFLLERGGEEAKQLTDSVLDAQLGSNSLLRYLLPAFRIEMFNNRYNIIAYCNRTVEVAKDDTLFVLFMLIHYCLIPQASIAAFNASFPDASAALCSGTPLTAAAMA